MHPAGQRHQTRIARYKTGFALWRGTVDLTSSPVKDLLPMAQQNLNSLTFTTQFSDPHFHLSAHTFARDTIPFNNISFALDLLTHDDAATQNLLILDRVNQAIIGLERQLDEHRQLVARHFSSLLQQHSAQHFPQRFHEYLHPDCGRCRLRR